MIVFPPYLAATWYPGYYWHTTEEKLYSIKVSGELREMKRVFPNHFNRIHEPGYRVSVEGRTRFMPLSKLKKLTVDETSVVPYRGDR